MTLCLGSRPLTWKYGRAMLFLFGTMELPTLGYLNMIHIKSQFLKLQHTVHEIAQGVRKNTRGGERRLFIESNRAFKTDAC